MTGCSATATSRAVDAPVVVRAQTPAQSVPKVFLPTPPLQQTAADPPVYLPLTLREAIESALSDSSVIRVLNGGVNLASITPTDALIAAQRIELEQGRFQPRLSANYDASHIDQPPNAFFGPGIAANTRRDATSASARVTQPLKTGGSMSLGLEPPLAYLFLPNGVDPGEFNPLYSTDYVLRVSQPVLRGAGRDIATAPIQIAQLQANQSRFELEETLNDQIRSVTEGYWRLYAAHLQLEAVKAVLPLAEESVRIEELRFQAERSIKADVARSRFQLDGFRRTQALVEGDVRRRVLLLRQLMGGEPAIQPLLLPSERPQETPPPTESEPLVQVAIENRPNLNRLREGLAERQVIMHVAANGVLPSLDLRGEYRSSGLTDRLDSSFRQASTSDYTDWTLGVGVDIPIGNQTALSRRRVAELEFVRDQLRLSAGEQSVAFEITELVSDLRTQWERLELTKRQALETQEWLRVSRIRYTQPPASGSSQDWLLLALTDLQSAMRSYVDSVGDVGEALAEYNTLLARLNRAQGLSVYNWRQQAAESDASMNLGGHSGFQYIDYRSDPHRVLSNLRPTASHAGPRSERDLPLPSVIRQAGHSFLAVDLTTRTPSSNTSDPLRPRSSQSNSSRE